MTEEKNIIDNWKLMSECNISTELKSVSDLTVMTYNVQELGDVSSIPSEVETVFSGYEYEAGIQRNKSLMTSLMPLKIMRQSCTETIRVH